MDKLNVQLLGGFDARLRGEPLYFNSDKLRALLAYLLIEARPHRREVLAGLLWGEMPSEKAATNLRLSLSRLRQSLEPFLATLPEDAFLEITRTTVQVSVGSACAVDALLFDGLLAAVELHPHDDPLRCSVCARRLAEAVALYRGDFLSGLNLPDAPEFEEWQVSQREQGHHRAVAALDALIAYHMAAAAWDDAARYVEQQLALEPWREDAYRRLISIRLAQGDRGGALAAYERCRLALDAELGSEPDAATEALYQRALALAARPEPAETGVASIPNNLPTQRLPFFGREEELRDLAALLIDPAYRLVTLTGIGGAGKSRLGLAVARRVLRSFPDGVWFVPLAAIDGDSPAAGAAVLQAIAAALGYQFSGGRSERDQVLGYLANKRLLLLLDNFEQLVGVADVALDILDAAQEVKLLVTSRERLLFQEEYAWLLGNLTIPPEGATNPHEYSSVQLFVSRAGQHAGGFTLTPENGAAVAHVCRLVDGSPLAIELAASWAFDMSPAQIATQIASNVDFLQTSMRNLPPRHRSMRAVFDGSWALLSAAEKENLARLALFRGSFSLGAVREIAGLSDADLRALSLKSLVARRDGDRYEMHELLREYAGEKRGADAALPDAHSRYYLAALAAQSAAMEGESARPTLAALQLDSANVRAAWDWAVERQRWPTLLDGMEPFAHYLWVQGLYHEGVRLYGAASRYVEGVGSAGDEARLACAGLLIEEAAFLTALGRVDESVSSLNRALALLDAADQPGLLVRGWQNLATALRRMGRFPEAVARYEQAVGAARAADLPLPLAAALSDLGRTNAEQGYFEAAARYLGEALAIYRRENNLRGQSIALNGLGMVSRRQGNYAAAHEFYSQTLQVAERIDYREGVKVACANLGLIFEGLAEYNRALDFFRRSLGISRQIGDRWGEGMTVGNMGTVYIHYGDYEQAQRQFSDSLAIALEINDLQGQTWAHQHLSWVTRLRRDPATAQRHAEEALLIARQINDRDNVGFALLHLGYALLERGDTAGAIERFRENAALRREMGQPGLLNESLAGLILALLAAGEVAEARRHAAAILATLSHTNLAGTLDRFTIYWACHQALVAAAEPAAAREILAQAHQHLNEEAARIDNEEMRQSFLNKPLHRRITRAFETE